MPLVLLKGAGAPGCGQGVHGPPWVSMGLRAVGLVTRAVFSLVGSVCTGKRQAALSLPAQRCWLFRAVSYVEPCLLVSGLPAFKP